jgi:hypothetical protein
MTLIPIEWPPNTREFQEGYCWRCDTAGNALVPDPMMPLNDKIEVCAPCAVQRHSIGLHYKSAGTRLAINLLAG